MYNYKHYSIDIYEPSICLQGCTSSGKWCVMGGKVLYFNLYRRVECKDICLLDQIYIIIILMTDEWSFFTSQVDATMFWRCFTQ